MHTRPGHHKRQRSDDTSIVAKRSRHDENGLQRTSGLAHLPEEVLLLILDTILGSLPRSHGLVAVLRLVASLHSLSLTNKTFHRLATPYLCAFITNRNRRKLPQVLDTIILDPKKAESIKYISWVLDVYRSSQVMCRRSPIAETIYLRQLGRLGIPELTGDLRQCFDGNSPEYHLATALILAPNLEYLEAADVNYAQETFDGATWRPIWLELLALKALSRPPGLAQHFQRLHHLHINIGELSFEQIGPVLRLPALRTLHLVGGRHSGRIAAIPWDKEVSKGCSTVETLILEYCSVSSQIIAQILESIKHLRVLKLELDYWFWSLSGDDNLGRLQHSWSTLSKAISEHKDSLERLYLIDRGFIPMLEMDCWEGKNPLDGDHMECLQDLPNLKYLDTGSMAFHTELTAPRPDFRRMLLPSLEHLIIKAEDIPEYDLQTHLTCLQDLAADCRSRLPVLQDVVVWLPRVKSGAHRVRQLDLSACKAAFASLGIDIILLTCDLHVKDNPPMRQPIWGLHPSTIEGSSGEPSLLGRGGWGCHLQSLVHNHVQTDGRARVTLHGPHSAYHDPYGWSIIDDWGRKHRQLNDLSRT